MVIAKKTSSTPPAGNTGCRHCRATSPSHRSGCFYLAQRRGFPPGKPFDDWATAEREEHGLIASGHVNP